jgi:hypothetical protein
MSEEGWYRREAAVPVGVIAEIPGAGTMSEAEILEQANLIMARQFGQWLSAHTVPPGVNRDAYAAYFMRHPNMQAHYDNKFARRPIDYNNYLAGATDPLRNGR